MDRLEIINRKRELEGISWAELAENLPVSGNALRQAFSRKSVKDSYLDIIERALRTKSTNKDKRVDEPKKVYLTNKEVRDKFEDITNEELVHVLVSKFDELIAYPTLKLLIEREVYKKEAELSHKARS